MVDGALAVTTVDSTDASLDIATAVEGALQSQARTRELSLQQLRASNEAASLAEQALSALVESRKAAQSAAAYAADDVLQAVERALRRYVGGDEEEAVAADAQSDNAASAAGVKGRLNTVLHLVECLGATARGAEVARDGALQRVSRLEQECHHTELRLAEALGAHRHADAEAERLRSRLAAAVAARSAAATPAAAAETGADQAANTPRRALESVFGESNSFRALPTPGSQLAELLVTRDMLQAELNEREAALEAAHRALSDAQATAAVAARSDATNALEQANRQVRSLATAVKRAVAAQETAQEELRAATARAKTAEEEAAAHKAEAALARATASKLTRAMAAAASAPLTAQLALPSAHATGAVDGAALQSRVTAALSAERATCSRLQREVELLRSNAARAASRERELEQALSRARAAHTSTASDRELRALVKELALAEAAARSQLAAAEARQLRMSEELTAARERVADLTAAMGEFALRHDALHRAEATLVHLAAEKEQSASMAPPALALLEREASQPEHPDVALDAPSGAEAHPSDDAPVSSDDVAAARASAAALSESLAALVSLSPSRAFELKRAVPMLPEPEASFAPTELSDENDDDDGDRDVGPDAVAQSAAALAAAEQEAARLSAHERALRKDEEQAVANSIFCSELLAGARAAVTAAREALAASDPDADPKTHRSLTAAKARAEQEAARAEENARIAAAAASAASTEAAAAADAAAVARATATAKAFVAARMTAAERRHADFSAKLQALQSQSNALAHKLRAERAACSRAHTEATALMAVLSASGRQDLAADAAARTEAFERSLDGEVADFPPMPPVPAGFDDRIQHAGAERDRLTDRLATVRVQRQAADQLVAFLSQRLDKLKADAQGNPASNSQRPKAAAQGGSLFGLSFKRP